MGDTEKIIESSIYVKPLNCMLAMRMHVLWISTFVKLPDRPPKSNSIHRSHPSSYVGSEQYYFYRLQHIKLRPHPTNSFIFTPTPPARFSA